MAYIAEATFSNVVLAPEVHEPRTEMRKSHCKTFPEVLISPKLKNTVAYLLSEIPGSRLRYSSGLAANGDEMKVPL